MTDKYIGKGEIENLVLGGASVWGYSYIGALRKLFTENEIGKVRNYIATSAGSIMAAILACSGTINYLSTTLEVFDTKKLLDNSFGYIVDLYRLFNEFGYNKGDYACSELEKILLFLTGNCKITLSDVYVKYGKNLVITGVNVNKRKIVYFNRLQHPNMTVVEAVRISISLPFYFRSPQYEGDYYVDGGVIDVLPCSFLATDLFKMLNNMESNADNLEEAIKNLYDLKKDIKILDDTEFYKNILRKTICMKAYANNTLCNLDPNYVSDHSDKNDKNMNIIDFVKQIINILTDTTSRLHTDDSYWSRTVKINVKDLADVGFDINDEQKHKLIKLGEEAAIKFINDNIEYVNLSE